MKPDQKSGNITVDLKSLRWIFINKFQPDNFYIFLIYAFINQKLAEIAWLQNIGTTNIFVSWPNVYLLVIPLPTSDRWHLRLHHDSVTHLEVLKTLHLKF